MAKWQNTQPDLLLTFYHQLKYKEKQECRAKVKVKVWWPRKGRLRYLSRTIFFNSFNNNGIRNTSLKLQVCKRLWKQYLCLATFMQFVMLITIQCRRMYDLFATSVNFCMHLRKFSIIQKISRSTFCWHLSAISLTSQWNIAWISSNFV